jgi:predicted porin
MKKNLLALAVGATVAAAPIVATQADVKVWGRLEVELVNVDGGTDVGGDAPTEIDSRTAMGDAGGQSRFGIDASKDLGNGLKAIGRYAWKTDPSNGADISARDQWVGLAGGFGKVLFGRLPSHYKMYGGVKWDPYTATFMEARRSGGMSGDALGHNGFVNDIIAYVSPKLGAVEVALGYIADDSAGTDGSIIAAAKAGFGPIELMGAYQNIEQPAGTDDITQMKAGIRYNANGLTAAWQYEDVDNSGSVRVNGIRLAGGQEAKINFLNLGYKFGNTRIAGNYGKTDAANNGQDVDYFALGVTYFLAKKVRVYGGYAQTELAEKSKLWGAGMRYDF